MIKKNIYSHRFTIAEKQNVRLLVDRARIWITKSFELAYHCLERRTNTASSFVKRYYDSESNGGLFIVERPDLFDQLKIKGCKYQFPSSEAPFFRAAVSTSAPDVLAASLLQKGKTKKTKKKKKKKKNERKRKKRGEETKLWSVPR